MKRVFLSILLIGAMAICGCQSQPGVSIEEHHSKRVQKDISTDTAILESKQVQPGPDQLESGPVEIHRETIVERVESEEVVVD